MLRTLLSRLRELERRCDAWMEARPWARWLCAVWVLNVLVLVALTFVFGPQAWRLMLWPFVEVE